MSAVAESFKGYQYYEFNMLKELCEPSKKLATESGGKEGDSDGSGGKPKVAKKKAPKDAKKERKPNKNSETNGSSTANEVSPSDEEKSNHSASSTNASLRNSHKNLASASEDSANSDPDLLINFDEKKEKKDKEDTGSLNNLLDDSATPGNAAEDAFLDFGFDDEKSIDEIKKQQDAEFDLSGEIVKQMEHKKNIKEQKKEKEKAKGEPIDLMSGELDFDEEKDDMTLLNEIFDAPSAGEDEFTREWQAVFGNNPSGAPAHLGGPQEAGDGFDYMPSNLLESLNLNSSGGKTQAPSGGPQLKQGAKSKQKKGQKTDMSAWFSLFADLDPLSNPDAIGRNPEELNDAL